MKRIQAQLTLLPVLILLMCSVQVTLGGKDLCAGVKCPTGRCEFSAGCDPLTGRCKPSFFGPPGTPCDDGKKCTTGDVCDGRGHCIGTQKVCSSPKDTPCQTRSCNKLTGTCSVVGIAPSGTPCNDGNACTVKDMCIRGVCVGKPKCPPSKKPCIATCDPTTGRCASTFLPPKTPCDDGKKCTTGDMCDGEGHCAGTPMVCRSPTQCQTRNCDERTGNCTVVGLVRNGKTCNDGSMCTVKDRCLDGVCVGTPKCPPSLKPCQRNNCNPRTGGCTMVNLAYGTPCNDGKSCTTGDRCDKKGNCIGKPKICPSPADAPCTTGKCKEPSGKCTTVNLGDGTQCNDSNNCTVGDVCTSGVCAGTLDVSSASCGGGNPACASVCTEPTGPCAYHTCNTTGVPTARLPPPVGLVCVLVNYPDNTICNDGNMSTRNDRCISGVCQGV